jgi:prepilin-type N-terminal cleavage/methylation domain-containing protein
MNTQQKEKGFTIIEVVLVLAIAGLIFLMVFIALPALQRSQRDTQRQQDMSRAQTAIQNYQSTNRGQIPTTDAQWDALANSYLRAGGDQFTDPSGKEYVFVEEDDIVAVPSVVDATESDQDEVRIYYTNGATCSTGGAVEDGQGSRKVALRLVLEGGGVACVNN